MADDPPRSRAARQAAEQALVRIVQAYGARPELVVLGGLIPDLLCSKSERTHAGTTDIDVQVDLEIASDSVNGTRLERALRDAGFEPDSEHVWRWKAGGPSARAVVKLEMLADLTDERDQATILFDGCDDLGAVNLRGTRYASLDVEVRRLAAGTGTEDPFVEINVTGLAGFLLAKCAAARNRRKKKDWYDIAFVLIHNDRGGPEAAARAIASRFSGDLPGLRTTFDDLAGNFADPRAQGPQAYVEQMMLDHPELEPSVLAADAVLAVETFLAQILGR